MIYNYIINPKTNRKVSIYGRIGKSILFNYLKYLKGGSERQTRLQVKSKLTKYSNNKMYNYDKKFNIKSKLLENVIFENYDNNMILKLRNEIKILNNIDTPIYIIICHGEFSTPLTVREPNATATNASATINKKFEVIESRISSDTYPEHVDASPFFRKNPENTFILYNSAPGTVAYCSKMENQIVNDAKKNPAKFKQTVFSHKTYFNTICDKKEQLSAHYFPPTGYYSNKSFYFYDDIDGDEYTWVMGIYPIINKKFNEKLPEYNFDYLETTRKLETNEDMRNRLINIGILDSNAWNGSKKLKKLKKKYNNITKLIVSRLPKYEEGPKKKRKRESSGKSVLMSEIMDKLGKGIYITLNCSTLNETSGRTDVPVKNEKNIGPKAFKERISKFTLEKDMEQVANNGLYLRSLIYKEGRRSSIRQKSRDSNCVTSTDGKEGTINTRLGRAEIFAARRSERLSNKTAAESEEESSELESESESELESESE